MNIQDLDLNLLLVFDAIYRERSISGAASKLDLSQPAVSNALRRLREYTGDTLFFRLGNEMKPTRMGNALAVPIGHALTTVRDSLNAVRAFDPKTSTRTFRIDIHEAFRQTLLPTLISIAEREAPGIRLEFLPVPKSADDTAAALREETLDLGMLSIPPADNAISFSRLHHDELIFVVRSNHPLLSRPITKDDLSNLRWIVYSSAPAMRTMTEKIFEQAGITRRWATTLPDTAIAPAILEISDLVAIMGRSMFDRSVRDYAIAPLPLPIKLPSIQMVLVWSKSADDDQGLLWLRRHIEQIMRAATSLNN